MVTAQEIVFSPFAAVSVRLPPEPSWAFSNCDWSFSGGPGLIPSSYCWKRFDISSRRQAQSALVATEAPDKNSNGFGRRGFLVSNDGRDNGGHVEPEEPSTAFKTAAEARQNLIRPRIVVLTDIAGILFPALPLHHRGSMLSTYAGLISNKPRSSTGNSAEFIKHSKTT